MVIIVYDSFLNKDKTKNSVSYGSLEEVLQQVNFATVRIPRLKESR